jgi:Ig-like domain from next to BRCA1 gene/LysM domain
MHWEKEIRIRITIRRIVIAVLAASTVANLVIVGVVFGADSPPATLTVTSILTTASPTPTRLISPSLPGETATVGATEISGVTPTNPPVPTPTSTDSPIWMVCIKRFFWPSYQVQPGDTLFSLASTIDSTVIELRAANCLANDDIRAGQWLYVPRLPVNITLTPSPTSTSTQTPTATPSQTSTSTATASATLTNSPTATVTPSQTETATYTPTNTAAAFCEHAEFVADVTVPSGTVLSPGERFIKTWRFRNIGSCDWTPLYSIAYMDGEQFGAPDLTPLPTSVAPGQTVDISIEMTAPSQPGSYGSYWMFRNPNGALFGIGPQANESWTMEITVARPIPTDVPTVFEGPAGYPACDGFSTVYFQVTPFDPQEIGSVTVHYTTSEGILAEAPMKPDGTTYYGQAKSTAASITYFFRAVDGFENVTDSEYYQFSTVCP